MAGEGAGISDGACNVERAGLYADTVLFIGLAVDRVDERLLAVGLSGALVVGEVTADEDVGADLDLSAAVSPRLVAKPVDAVCLEILGLVIVESTIVGDPECSGTLLLAVGVDDLGDDA